MNHKETCKRAKTVVIFTIWKYVYNSV